MTLFVSREQRDSCHYPAVGYRRLLVGFDLPGAGEGRIGERGREKPGMRTEPAAATVNQH
jgi:hypothetical protein